MESWSRISEGMGWELNDSCSFDSSFVNTTESETENQGFLKLELDVSEMIRKSSSQNSLTENVLCSKVCDLTSNSQDSSSSVVESTGQDSSVIDLKLSRIADQRGTQGFRSPILSSPESFVPLKRIRAGLSSQMPFCQVHGCKKDLSSSKSYHKRHKVCEVHSKTAKVIVNGIEQRFCQQCSRFHLLAEFDGEKRSCRKRLAGHNERRRKPHVGIQSGRSGKLVSLYNGSGYQGSKSTTSSFFSQDVLMNDWNGHIKHEDGANYFPQSASSITNENPHTTSLFVNGFEKHCPFEKHFTVNSNLYLHDLGAKNSVSSSLIHGTSTGNEDFVFFDTESTIQGMSASGRALSLLSPESQNSSSHSSGIPPGLASYRINQVPGKLLEVSSPTSIDVASNKFNFSAMNSVEENYFGSILSNHGDTANFTDGPTIDLLQLSTQLQQVEHQRQHMQLKG
ncbi:hypothetical protein NMG60_11005812 [Bertholletia excelsa]